VSVKILLAVALLGCISACAEPYRAPTDGPQATVVSKANVLYLYANDRCEGARRVQAPLFGDQAQIPPTVQVAANGPIYVGSAFDRRGLQIGAGDAGGGAYKVDPPCIATGSFTPVEDATYEVSFRIDDSHRNCSLKVERVNKDGSRAEELSYKPFYNRIRREWCSD